MALRSTDDTTNGERPPERPTVAAFDFDGTLTDRGSVFPFLVSLRGTWPVLRAALRLSPALLRAAVTGGTAADEVKEKLFHRLLGGMPVDELEPALGGLRPAPPAAAPARQTPDAGWSGTAARATTPSSSRPHPSATSAPPVRSSVWTGSSPPGWRSAVVGC